MPLSAAFAPGLPSLTDSLYARTVEELKWYAGALPGKKPIRKDDLVTLLRAALTDPAQLRGLLAAMSPGERDVVALAVAHGGYYDSDMVEARYPGVAKPTGPSYYYSYGSDRKRQADPFELVFFHQPYTVGTYIPPEVLMVLRPLVGPVAALTLPAQAEVPPLPELEYYTKPELRVVETEAAALHDLGATLYVVQSSKLGVSSATHLPTLPALRQLRPRLLLADYWDEDYGRAEDAMRPLALTLLVQAARWATPAGAGGKLELSKAGQKVLAGSLGAPQVREAWERWVKSDLLDELSRVRAIKGQQSKNVRLTKPSERRESLVAGLRACPVGQWVRFDDWLRHLRAERLLPAIERNELSGLHIGYYNSFESYIGYSLSEYWDLIIGSYLRVALWEYAGTLGLVDLAYTDPDAGLRKLDSLDYFEDDYLSRYDGLWAFRLTALGAYALGLTDTYTPAQPTVPDGPPVLKVLPNLDLVITDVQRLTHGDRAMLERISSVQSDVVYRLSRDVLLDAVETGLDLDTALAFLAGRSGQAVDDLPQTVRVFFRDVAARLGTLRLGGTMRLIECGDALLLAELSRQPGLRGMAQLAQIGDRAALLVPADQEAATRRHLKKLGYLLSNG